MNQLWSRRKNAVNGQNYGPSIKSQVGKIPIKYTEVPTQQLVVYT